jgi:polar amino acid transport system permease protein
VSIVAVPDLMYQATRLVAQLFKPVEIYTSVAVLYLIIVYGLSMVTRMLQRRWQDRESGEVSP